MLGTGWHGLQHVHAMCFRALASATGCTEIAEEPRLLADLHRNSPTGPKSWGHITLRFKAIHQASAASGTGTSNPFRMTETKQ
jgi:hypothetical protein